jgi:S-formylglutathione hydrolase FrmB
MINQRKDHSILKVILLSFTLITLLFIAGCNNQSTETEIGDRQVKENKRFTRIEVSFPVEIHPEPITARVLLFASRSDAREPRFFNTFNLQPVYAIDVTNFKPEQKLVFSADMFYVSPGSLFFPNWYIDGGTYYLQALIDLDNTSPDFNFGPGNLYSQVIECIWPMSTVEKIELVTDRVIEGKTTPEDADRIKLVEIRSNLLSDFYSRDFKLRAGVVLPDNYNKEGERQFPTLYRIPGFGNDHTDAWRQQEQNSMQFIQVYLDPTVPLGHSVFADSANNGPCGEALIKEFIPEIEKRFRVIPHAYGRFVTGHSSGGWSSLWLQITYPDVFGGCWSLAPDPVDFRAFQTINIYEDRNGHWTPEGYPRPHSRRENNVRTTFGQINRWEYVVGYGFNLDSFNAVFSPRGADGRPLPIMDKLTGTIDHEVAEYWKHYDIRIILEEKWPSLGPKLKGKIHLIAGAWDTVYLNNAVEYLNDFLKTTDYGGYVEIHPGNHSTFMTDQLLKRIEKEMAKQFAAEQKEFQKENNMQSQKRS